MITNEILKLELQVLVLLRYENWTPFDRCPRGTVEKDFKIMFKIQAQSLKSVFL